LAPSVPIKGQLIRKILRTVHAQKGKKPKKILKSSISVKKDQIWGKTGLFTGEERKGGKKQICGGGKKEKQSA